MTPIEVRTILQFAQKACLAGDAKAFASLFSNNAELIVSGDRVVGRAKIERITAEYFRTCKVVAINIHRTIVESDRAVVEWTWEAIAKGKHKSADNAIVISFQAGLISGWREYTSPHVSSAQG